MRILLCSYDFYPSVGGTETAGMTLALGLAERGYEVTVATATPAGDSSARFPFGLVRAPGPAQLLALFRRADLVWQNQVSLRLLWPMLLVPRPMVIVHHSPLATDTGPGPRFAALKRTACRLGHNAFVSQAYREAARLPGPVIYNSYDEKNFHPWPDVAPDRDVVFLGRLTQEKGADILVDALALLAREGMRLEATIVGAGPQEAALRTQVREQGMSDHVQFTGVLRGEALSRMLARHRLMAMPSRWFEGLPIASIEAMACGCVVIGSDSGGLPEAIGPCGLVTTRDSAQELASALSRLTSDGALYAACRAGMAQHLSLFSGAALMNRCEQLIRQAVRGSDRSCEAPSRRQP